MTSDGGLILVRELDERLGLSVLMDILAAARIAQMSRLTPD